MSFKTLKTGAFGAAAVALLSAVSATGAAAQACPDWQLGGVPISTNAEAAWVPQNYAMYAGGQLNLTECPTVPGVGYLTPAPNFTLQYDAMTMGRDLEFRVESECDTTLLVNTSSAQWEFNDDMNGFNPGMRLSNAPSGQYDIWVGTYGNAACSATLIAETFEHQPEVCPDWQLGGAELNVATGQSATRPVVAGGSIDLFQSRCEIPAHGYVAQAPDFTLFFDNQNQPSTLDISVTADCDTTLLVNDPNVNWVFNDDAVDLHPGITIGDAVAGRYDIWVGTYGSPTCQATINIAANSPQAPQPPAGSDK